MTQSAIGQQKLYTARFFTVLGALFFFMAGYNLLVHLAKYVVHLGGDVATVSWIFGIGMIGSLLARPFVGRWIDSVGCKPVLLSSTIVASLAILSFQFFESLGMIAVLRILVQLTQAALLTTIAVFCARIAPPGRSAEGLAMVGVGGLAGMMIGPVIGDAVFGPPSETNGPFGVYFTIGAALMLASAAFIAFTPSPRLDAELRGSREPFLRLLLRYWPGPVVVLGFCLALVQTVPVMFIERFVADRQLEGVTYFFIAYSPTAITLRLTLRRLPYRLGRRRTLIFGFCAYITGLVLLMGTHSAVGLAIPAIVMGTGHCFSYPFLVDLAAEKMPPHHRGVATAAILGVIDLGFLVGFIAVGQIVKRYGFNVALTATAVVSTTGVVYFAWTQRHMLFARTTHACGANSEPPRVDHVLQADEISQT